MKQMIKSLGLRRSHGEIDWRSLERQSREAMDRDRVIRETEITPVRQGNDIRAWEGMDRMDSAKVIEEDRQEVEKKPRGKNGKRKGKKRKRNRAQGK